MANRAVRHRKLARLSRFAATLLLIGSAVAAPLLAAAQTASAEHCRIDSVDFDGWKAQRVSNRWVKLLIVPQNGGRLMQITFGDHAYLFVNPQLAGKYMPPSQDTWFNYGGDKLWLLPEGDDDEQHWRGNSDLLDDGEFSFRNMQDRQSCGIELTGQPDPHTGIQFIRSIRLDSSSPHIAFRAEMKNISGHTLEWSMQSVSQYDTGDPNDRSQSNREIWGFTRTNPSSGYLNRYHVRTGPAENPSATVRDDGLFSVHYSHLAAEFWVDSTDGWLAVIDGKARYAMVERFRYEHGKQYPGKASVIFWTNGPHLKFDGDGAASISDNASPFYMEAEINSPMCRLRSGESCSLETDWFPTRADSEFHEVTDAGIVTRPLRAIHLEDGKVRLSGSFGVFFAGKLVAHFYDGRGSHTDSVTVAASTPTNLVVLDAQTEPQGKPARVSLHLEDESGLDRGSLGEVPISTGDIR